MSAHNDRVIAEFREHGGEVERFGRRLILLHDRGAQSGTEYVHPVSSVALEHGSRLICASAMGRDANPPWYRNLLAHPDVEIETPDGTVAVRAVALAGAERDAAWERFILDLPRFADYQAETTRVLPMVRLEPR